MKKIRPLKVIEYNLFGLALVAAAVPTFGFQGALQGTPGDSMFHTIVRYVAVDFAAGGGILALGIGGISHSVSPGERGHNWLWGGVVGVWIPAPRKFSPSLARSPLAPYSPR